jgi:hypothetical protein
MTQADRDAAALDDFRSKPCSWCRENPKASGDHLCVVCRKRAEDARKAYEDAKEGKKNGTVR